ncbi:stereocilin [Sphaeramia orbicularis]|uniref:stereocilin n=1 Tax=Sphaeramia orbicularis TaxID=375764 RepID=UPI00117DA318|nr:stereocilin-like [Sphaeramia orbicularis]
MNDGNTATPCWLGNISCLADPEDLLMYKNTEAFIVIQDILINCTREGLSLPSHLLSSLLLDNNELKDPSSLTPQQLAKVAHLLPVLGVNFLQDLTPTQLAAVLPVLQTVKFSPAQAAIIVEKLSAVMTLSAPGKLEELGSLVVGVKAEFFLSQTADRLLASLPAMAQRTPALSHVQCTALSTKLWGYLEVVNWLDYVEPLLYCTPLLSVQPRAPQLAYNISTTSTKGFNTQQAKAIFKQLQALKPNLIKDDFESLGTVGQGVSCTAIKERLKANLSPASVRKILAFLRQQPTLLHTSLKKCVVEEVYQYEFFPNILEDLGAELALSMPVSIIKKFSVESTNTLRKLIIQHPFHFLLLSRIKQDLLVDKIVQRMRMYTGVFTEEEFRSLGHLAPFVPGEVFVQLDRRFFVENLNFLQEFCYGGNKMDIVARILQEPATFGPVKTWNKATLSQVDRFTFFLSLDKIQEIPKVLMTVGRIEKLFMSQHQWEKGDVGSHCLDANERQKLFEKKQFLLQFFLGFLKIHHLSPTPMIPTCGILHTTAPSAWTPNSLTSMSASAFSNCLELMGQDQFMASYQRSQVLNKVKQMYGPVSSFSQLLISQLGALAVEMTSAELSSLRLTQRRAIAALGAIPSLNVRQLEALFAAMLNSTKQIPSQIDASTFEALGYIVCGAKVTEMSSFNAVEFSKAMLWLGRLDLKCTEDQMLALVGLLSHSLAFGPISSWGTDVFIEIGILAAGLPDIAMSALVKEQIEGISPLAISKIVPEKFAVVFSAKQISMFSHDQAFAVTKEQILALNYVQKTALDMVLTPWADKLVDFRGRSLGLALSPSPMCLILGLLMPLIILCCPGT